MNFEQCSKFGGLYELRSNFCWEWSHCSFVDDFSISKWISHGHGHVAMLDVSAQEITRVHGKLRNCWWIPHSCWRNHAKSLESQSSKSQFFRDFPIFLDQMSTFSGSSMNFALHGIAQRRGLFLVMEAEVREMAGFFFSNIGCFRKRWGTSSKRSV